MKIKKCLISLLAVLTIGAGAVGLTACGGGNNNESPVKNEKASEGLEYTLSDDKMYYIVGGIGTCKDTKVVIPDTYNNLPVTSIGNYAFEDCSSLTEIVIPDSVTSIGYWAFEDCSSLTEITVDEDNANYSSLDGNLYNKEKTTLIQYAIGKTATLFEIPDGVTSIGYDAFSSCSSLTGIVIPDSVTSIGDLAFDYCSNLTGIVIPASVTSIGSSAFDNCSSLTNVVIGNSVTSIGEWAFYKCSSLTSIQFEGTVEQWNAIEKGYGWNNNVPATEVVCSDGVVVLTNESEE